MTRPSPRSTLESTRADARFTLGLATEESQPSPGQRTRRSARPSEERSRRAGLQALHPGCWSISRPSSAPSTGAGLLETDQGSLDARLTQRMLRFQESRSDRDFDLLYQESAFDLLVWIRSLLRQSGPGVDAIEILQDTFVNIFRYPGAFRSEHPGSFRVWARTIAGNAVRRARRQNQGRTQALEDQLEEARCPQATPQERAEGLEFGLQLERSLALLLAVTWQAFGRLKARDHRALELVELLGKPYSEAGPALDVQPENMKMIVFRARRRLFQEIVRVLV